MKIAHSPKMIGHSISHYRIVSQLGVGGMGIVYEHFITKSRRARSLVRWLWSKGIVSLIERG